MTYTTEEKVKVEELRFANKVATLEAISELETVYKNATQGAMETLRADTADIRADGRAALADDIMSALSDMRNNGDDIDE